MLKENSGKYENETVVAFFDKMSSILRMIQEIDYRGHIFLAFLVRLAFITYGSYQDKYSTVRYTDVDYNVFTDAARHVINNESPYDRHTYRYSPLIAILLTPNVLLHDCFGKVLFSLADLLVGLLIRTIVKGCFKTHEHHTVHINKKNLHVTNGEKSKNKTPRLRIKNKQGKANLKMKETKKEKDSADLIADVSMCIWLYNPLSIAIATRGNSDSLAGLLVLIVLYYMQIKEWYFIAGILHGFSVHLRLYPIIYSLSLFMYLSKFSFYETQNRKSYIKSVKSTEDSMVKQEITILQKRTIFKKEYLFYFIPNANQLKLVSGCLLSLTFLTGIFFFLYGYPFLYETYLYHLIRNDNRHNFSLYFYLQYLTAGVKNIGYWQKVLMVLPKIVLLLVFSVRYGLNKYSLNFSILTQTLVMVIYNTVLTSQYFIWILCILPLCIWQIKVSLKKTLSLFTLWFAAQIAWLLPAYFLEFQGQNTFLLIWLQSVSLFCAHIAILGRLVKYFVPFSSHVD